ncbi:MAG: cytochrome bc complex cytochrome b subunit [Planctomycetota bacterium]
MGGLLLALFSVQVFTGLLLALYYSPSASEAWESIQFIEERVRAGSIIRGMHHFAAWAFVVLLVVHMGRTFLWAAYKGPRRWTWVVGCLLFFCILGFGFTGYLLPWDMKAYFGTRVGVEIAGSAPVLGPMVRKFMAGGASVGPLTLPRFYAAHVILLPLVTLFLIGIHLMLIRLHGMTPFWRKEREGPARSR